MPDKIKKLYKFSNTAENVTYYVLSNCSINEYVSAAMSRYNKRNQWSPVIDIIGNGEYKVQRLLVEETDVNNLKDCARFLIESDIYCINNQDLKPRSRETHVLLERQRARDNYWKSKNNGVSASM